MQKKKGQKLIPHMKSGLDDPQFHTICFKNKSLFNTSDYNPVSNFVGQHCFL